MDMIYDMAIRFVTTKAADYDVYRYVIIKTGWGYMGLRGWDDNISRLVLPQRSKKGVCQALACESKTAREDDKLGLCLQRSLIDYFEGKAVRFDCTLDISWASEFARKVLRCCSRIKPGQTISYGDLAHRVNRPRAARAVGGVMAKNRIPLIIPCHRVIAADGHLGGFSAAGSVDLKKRLLQHESKTLMPLT